MNRLFLFALLLLGLSAQSQDDCLMDAEISTTVALWGSEVSWTLSSLDGTLIGAGGDFNEADATVTTACLEDSCYVLLGVFDTFGDGWNGAEVTIATPPLD